MAFFIILAICDRTTFVCWMSNSHQTLSAWKLHQKPFLMSKTNQIETKLYKNEHFESTNWLMCSVQLKRSRLRYKMTEMYNPSWMVKMCDNINIRWILKSLAISKSTVGESTHIEMQKVITLRWYVKRCLDKKKVSPMIHSMRLD